MREWCGCGSAIRASRKDVLAWRQDHNHPPDRDAEKQGAESRTELSYHEPDQPTINARTIGFTRE